MLYQPPSILTGVVTTTWMCLQGEGSSPAALPCCPSSSSCWRWWWAWPSTAAPAWRTGTAGTTTTPCRPASCRRPMRRTGRPGRCTRRSPHPPSSITRWPRQRSKTGTRPAGSLRTRCTLRQWRGWTAGGERRIETVAEGARRQRKVKGEGGCHLWERMSGEEGGWNFF